MATKATTRKSAKKSGSTRPSVATSEPRVKALAQVDETTTESPEEVEVAGETVAEVAAVEPEAPAPVAYWVELVEGASYDLKGRTFARNRPVVITDAGILSSVLRNGRFKCRRAGGG